MAMPGQYPQFDQYPQFGGPNPSRPPQPAAVRNAVTAMYVGAGFSVLNSIWTVHEGNTSGVASHIVGVGGVVGGLVDVGLWVWMALANRAGHHWARVTGTVFFGICTFSAVATVLLVTVLKSTIDNMDAANGVNTTQLNGVDGATLILALVSWLIGLYATVMMWQKSAAPFYRQPAPYLPPVGWPVPGQAPYGYPYPSPYPPAQPPAGQAPLPPNDPWQTPQV
jgi:hypothetical protein